MIRLARMLAGTVTAVILAYSFTPSTSSVPTGIAIVIVGLVAGFMIGSWWSVPIAPIAFGVGAQLWRQVECRDCPPGEDGGEPLFTIFFVIIVAFGIPALSAAAGTLCAKYVEQRQDPTTLIGVTFPIIAPLLGYWLHDTGRIDLSTLPLLALGLLTIGFIAGLLLQRWWAVGYAAVIGIPWPLSVETSYFREPLIDMVAATLIWGMLPLAIGATIGVLASRIGERSGTTEIFS